MKLRVILVCTLLLLAAAPSFALPLCAHCNAWNECESSSGDYERCKYDLQGNCITTTERCSIPNAQSTVLSDYTVAAVEVTRPAQECDTVTTPATAAKVATPASSAPELK